MLMMQDLCQIEDREVPLLCNQGMTIVVDALKSPFFCDHVVDADISFQELLTLCKGRQLDMMRHVESMSRASPVAMQQAIYEKTLKEVKAGSMAGPFSIEEIKQRHGNLFNVIPSFGLAQGSDISGGTKYRRIDDHTKGLTNRAARRLQKIPIAMVNTAVCLTKSLVRANSCASMQNALGGVQGATEDMKGAYRQVPLADSQVSLSIAAVYDPAQKRAELFELYGQPFGAGHAVPNFYRVAEWLCRAVRRFYHINIEHFFDDFFYY